MLARILRQRLLHLQCGDQFIALTLSSIHPSIRPASQPASRGTWTLMGKRRARSVARGATAGAVHRWRLITYWTTIFAVRFSRERESTHTFTIGAAARSLTHSVAPLIPCRTQLNHQLIERQTEREKFLPSLTLYRRLHVSFVLCLFCHKDYCLPFITINMNPSLSSHHT